MAENRGQQGGGVARASAREEGRTDGARGEMAREEGARAVVPAGAFWRHPFAQNVMPVVMSILLHAGILLLGYGAFEAVRTVRMVSRDQVIVPDATLVENVAAEKLPNPGVAVEMNPAWEIKAEAQEQPPKYAEHSSIAVGGMGGEAVSDGVIGIGPGTGALRTGSGLGGDEAGGLPFGVPGGAAGAPKSPFMGVAGNAYRVVYLADASGSMLARRSLVIQSLKRSVEKLKPVQFFNVVFFHEGDFEAMERGQLVPASPVNKRKAFGFSDEMEARGHTDPSRAIQLVMSQKPQLVYLLTDGFDERVEDFAHRLRMQFNVLNRDRAVTVSIIYIADEGQFTGLGGVKNDVKRDEIISQLKAIAEENGGRFKFIDANGDTNW